MSLPSSPPFFMAETESHGVFGCCLSGGIKGLCYHAHPYVSIVVIIAFSSFF